MKVVDLHGLRHRDVYGALEKLCTEEDIPFVVITGNSSSMKRIVAEVAKIFNLYVREQLGNTGRVVICESR